MTVRFPQWHQLSGWPAALVSTALGLLHGVILYGAAGRDDSYITYWVAEQLVIGGRLVNINGDAVEQSSSLLHVLLLAASFALTRVPLPTLGVAFSASVGAALTLVAWREARTLEIPFPGLVPLYLAVFPYTVYWSFGGLETSLQALLALLAAGAVARFLAGSSKRLAPAVLALGGLILVRPESIFVIAAALALTAVLLAAARLAKARAGRVLRLAGASAAIFGAVCLLRWRLFGELFPHPVQAKVRLPLPVGAGLAYLHQDAGALSLVLLAVLALVSLLTAIRPGGGFAIASRLALIVFMSFVGSQLAFVLACGGDWMEGGRFLVPIVAPLLLTALHTLALIPRRLALASLLALAAATGSDLYGFQGRSMGTPIWWGTEYGRQVLDDLAVQRGRFSRLELVNRVHLRDIPSAVALSSVVDQLEVSGVRPVTAFSIQMGFVPYHVAGERGDAVRFVDMAGLATRDISDCAVTAGIAGSRFGSVVPYSLFFHEQALIRRECGIERPDVIFDLEPNDWGSPRGQAERNGYTVVFEATGRLPSRGLGRVAGGQFIAVRRELADSVALPRPLYVWP